MKAARREQQIISLLESRGEMSVSELSQLLDISVSTLRRQLALMQEKGLLIRTYGGVMCVNRVPDETFESKLHKNVSEKRRIAELARKLLPDGASVALGSGTSVYALATHLDDMNRGIIYANSIQAADYLSHLSGLEVHICGGIVRGRTGTVIGNEASEYFRGLRQVDFAFIGCDAINSTGDVLSDNLSVATAEQNILHCARHRYILCDSSKIGQSAVARITGLEDCEGLITCPSENQFIEHYRTLTNILYA